MLAIGAGGLQVAVVLTGEAFSFQMPDIRELEGHFEDREVQTPR